MDGPAFIRANTKLLPVPLVPEIRLYLAEESLPIWRKTEEELGQMNVPPPYWAFAWAGGQALARYLLDNPAAVAGAHVLDLGSGSGLTAIAAMRAGAARVLAADVLGHVPFHLCFRMARLGDSRGFLSLRHCRVVSATPTPCPRRQDAA
jgi:predicted nicotinamide N-methyase